MKRQSEKSRKPNRTVHQRAMESRKVAAAVRELHRIWDRIDPIERGDRLLDLAEQGCSRRGMGKAMRKSATNIRRHMTLAALPEEERAAVKAGSSAKKILAKKALADRRRKMRERIAADRRTGVFSNYLADIILEFCRTVNGVPETRIREYDMENFMRATRGAMLELESRGVKGTRFPMRFNLRKCFKLTRPPDKPDESWMGDPDSESWMGHRAKWLAKLLLTEAAESPIRHRAIEMAERRSEELRIKVTNMEAREQRRARLASILAGPPLRRFLA